MCSRDKGRALGTLALRVNNLSEETRTADTVRFAIPKHLTHLLFFIASIFRNVQHMFCSSVPGLEG